MKAWPLVCCCSHPWRFAQRLFLLLWLICTLSSPVLMVSADTTTTALDDVELKDDEKDDEGSLAIPMFVNIIFIILLVMLSGLFSGLTLGLMSLDKTGLEIVMESDDPVAAKAAGVIYPVRSNGNLLLCTLLLGNVAVNALLSILMTALSSGLVGFVASTAVIVVFGEILPQAACSRYALRIGSLTVPLVKAIILLLYVVAAPLALALDKLLGRELATTYSKSEMIKLLQIHVDKGVYDEETGNAMHGALNYQEKLVTTVMTPIDSVFMLDGDDKLSFTNIAKIFKSGYSRIPVCENSRDNIIGLLIVKDLIFVDPEDETPVKNMVQIFGRALHVVWPTDNLGLVLRELKQGKSHMALVRDVNNEDPTQDPFYEIKGIITLEDVIEEILGDEIVDETDAFVENTHLVRVDRENFDWGKLRLLDAKITDETLSHDEVKAVTAHLRVNHKEVVRLLSDRQLHKLVSTTSVTELKAAEDDDYHHHAGTQQYLPQDLLYEKHRSSDTCTLVLSGKVAVLSGSDNFRSDLSAWSFLAARALTDSAYAPDFTAFVSHGPCRCIQLTKERFTRAIDASVVEKSTSSPSVTTLKSLSSSSSSGLSRKKFTSSPNLLTESSRASIADNASDDFKIIPRSDRGHVLEALSSKKLSRFLEEKNRLDRIRDDGDNVTEETDTTKGEHTSNNDDLDINLNTSNYSEGARDGDTAITASPPSPREERKMTALQIELTNGGSLMPLTQHLKAVDAQRKTNSNETFLGGVKSTSEESKDRIKGTPGVVLSSTSIDSSEL